MPGTDISFEHDDKSRNLKVTIWTERLCLESVVESDTKSYYEQLYGNEEIMKTFMTGRTYEPKEMSCIVNKWTSRWENNNPFSSLKITKLEDNNFVGRILLSPKDKIGEEQPGIAELSYLIAKDAQGKKFAKEAASAVVEDYAPQLSEKKYQIAGRNFTEIIATARQDNHASIKILESVGFRKDAEGEKYGHLRNSYRKSILVDR